MTLPHYPRLVSPELLEGGAQGHLCRLRVPLRSAAQPRHHARLHTTTEVVAGVSGAPGHQVVGVIILRHYSPVVCPVQLPVLGLADVQQVKVTRGVERQLGSPLNIDDSLWLFQEEDL